MSRIQTSILALLVGFSVCQAASAELVPSSAPPSVAGIKAQYANGSVTVNWNPVTTDSVSFYRIYFSHASILGSSGNYDDFERTKGAETSYTFASLPLKSPAIYFSVLAVNAAGTESESFVEEAKVDISQDQPATVASSQVSSLSISSSGMAASSAPSGIAPALHLLRARPLAGSGIALDFTAPLSATQMVDTGSFLIVDESGSELKVTDVSIDGATLDLKTGPQAAGRVYVLQIMKPVSAIDGTTLAQPLPQVSFIGLAAAPGSPIPQAPASQASSSSAGYIRNPQLPPRSADTVAPADVKTLTLTPKRRPDGTYDVTITWQASPSADVASYILYASDDGITFDRKTEIASARLSVIFAGVPAEKLTVKVTAKDTSGNESPGIVKSVNLKNLPTTGVGLLSVFALSGAFAGSRVRRKKRA